MGTIKLPDNSGYEFEGETSLVSDGYHSFKELYEHRIRLFMTLCRFSSGYSEHGNLYGDVWASKFHHDGTNLSGWFILGISIIPGKQITYHLPNEYWNEVLEFANILPNGPVYDGHTSEDVLNRLKEL